MPLILAIGAVVIAVAAIALFTLGEAEAPVVQEDANTREVAEEVTTPTITDTDDEPEPPAPANDEAVADAPEPAPPTTPTPAASNAFVDGTYSTNATYLTPARKEHDIAVTLTISDDVITNANISYDGGAAATPSHKRFDDAYKAAVEGVAVADLSASRIGGASLTTEAFNEALVSIKAQAAS